MEFSIQECCDLSIQERWATTQQFFSYTSRKKLLNSFHHEDKDVLQSCIKKRHEAEESLIQEMIMSHPLDKRLHLEKMDGSSLSLLCEKGNLDGWAFVCGFSVEFYVSESAAIEAWHKTKEWLSDQLSNNAMEALGPRPTPCTLLDALIWGSGSLQAFF
jgi:hypothetical protein